MIDKGPETLVPETIKMDSYARVGCSGWYYWHWKGRVYPADLPTGQWLAFYQQTFDTVELNAPFYRWPKPATVKNWGRQAGPGFQYSIKVNQTITHEKRFKNTRKLILEFYKLAEPLADHLGCFLFQLPPSFHCTPARLRAIVDQLDPHYRNVIEFRHPSWWNDDVFDAFGRANLIFCSVSAPRLPTELVRTGDIIYLRFHGAARWYRHDYTDAELEEWAGKVRNCSPKEAWLYFNNDFNGCAFRNARTMKKLLATPDLNTANRVAP